MTRDNDQERENMRSLKPLLAVLYSCGFLAGFNENLMNMALVSVMDSFAVNAITAQWLVTGYMIAVAVVVACMAFLYRRFSLRRLFLAATLLNVVGSVGGLLAPNFVVLLLARLVQAMGTGVLIPLMMNVIVDRVPHGRLGTYLSIGGSMITVGPATAPVITGFLVSGFGWRSVFVVPLVAGLVLMAAGAAVVRNFKAPTAAAFDLLSVLLVAGGVTLLSMGLADIALRPVAGVAEMVGAVALLGGFAWRQKWLAEPLVSMAPFSFRSFWPAAIVVVVTMMTYFSLSVLAPLYFEEAVGLEASVAGLLMVVPVLANATAALLCGRVLDRRGEWPLLPVGLAIAAVGFATAMAGGAFDCFAAVVVGVLLGYLGTGMVLSPAQTAGLRRLPPSLNAHGVTLMSVSLQLSACLGPAAFVGLMSAGSAQAAAAGASAGAASSAGFAWAMAAALAVVLLGVVCAVIYARAMAREDAQ